jgi:hypothetical protein
MKTCYFIDTEFQEIHQHITQMDLEDPPNVSKYSRYRLDLISIGVVASDGREYYAQSCEFEVYPTSPWITENVYPHLTLCPHIATLKSIDHEKRIGHQQANHRHGQCTFEKPLRGIIGVHTDCPWQTHEQIKYELLSFMNIEKYGKPEFWLWCGSYDYVLLCQLFGGMMSLPEGWPHYLCDLQEVLDKDHIEDSELPPQEGTAHNALADARYIKRLWEAFG